MSKQAITWTNETRKLSELVPWERNPRYIKDKQARLLVDSVETFGQVETLAIGPDSEVYNGHQRLSVLAGQYGMDYTVDVRVASRALSEREREQLTVYLHQGATGQWDWDELANSFDFSDLVLWGFEPYELGMSPDGDGNSSEDEWGGMPEFSQEDKTSYQSIHIHFKDADEVTEFAELIGQSLTDKTRSIWYSQREKMLDANERYTS